MTFGAALFLLAAFAAIIPPILHMINRQRAKQLPFSTLRFLRISVQKTRRRRQIRDLLLMLLRMAVLILIAIGLARPTLSKIRSFFGRSNAAVAIVLDNSASMGWVDDERPRFERAIKAANQILAELNAGDEIGLWVTSGPRFPELGQLEHQHDRARQLLNQIAQRGPTFEGGHLPTLVAQAQERLSQTDAPQKYLFVITDNQVVSWEGLSGETDPSAEKPPAEAQQRYRDIPLVIIDCHRTPAPNVGIRNLTLHSVLPVAGLPMKAAVEVFNASPIAAQRVVELYLDGKKVATSPELNLDAESPTLTELIFTLDRGGVHQGEIRLVGEDGARFDDHWFFTVEIESSINVAIVVPEKHEIAYLDDSFYLERALQPVSGQTWSIKTTTLTLEQLASEPFSGFRVVYLVNLPAIEPRVAEKLVDFVESGGKIIWIAGENTDCDRLNTIHADLGGRLLPSSLDGVVSANPAEGRDSWRVNWIDVQHPALTGFEQPASLYQSILVYRYIRADATQEPGVNVLIRLEGGDPLLVERQIGAGRVLFLLTSAHVGWTNFPLRPIFSPLFSRLTFTLAAGESAKQASLFAGQPVVIPFTGQLPPGVIEVTPSDGSLLRITLDENQKREFRYENTHQTGFYQFRILAGAAPTQKTYAVNFDPDEISLEKIDRKLLEEYYTGIPLLFADNPEDLSGTFQMLRQGRSLAEFFLVLVLLGLVFETFISNWFSPGGEETKPRVLEQYRPTRRLAPNLG